MAAITPSTLLQGSMGNFGVKVAKFITTTVNSGDYWASNIPDIMAIVPVQVGNTSTATTTGIAISFTASNGTIFLFPAAQAATVTLLVYTGSAF